MMKEFLTEILCTASAVLGIFSTKFYWRKVVNFPNKKENWMIFLMIEFSMPIQLLLSYSVYRLSLSFRKPEGLIQVG